MREEDSVDDNDLMARIRNRDHQAFATLVQRHTQRFFACAYRLCTNVQESEDIVQEAFLKLWQQPELFDETKGVKFTTWFYRVVSNRTLDHLRKRKPQANPEILDYLPADTNNIDKEMDMDQKQTQLEEAIEELPERQKLALNLCFYEGLKNKEAADIMDINVKALESLLMRAKSNLRETLLRQGVINETREKRHAG